MADVIVAVFCFAIWTLSPVWLLLYIYVSSLGAMSTLFVGVLDVSVEHPPFIAVI